MPHQTTIPPGNHRSGGDIRWPLLISWASGAAVFGALTGAVAATAQNAARAIARSYGEPDLYMYSLAGHVAGVLALGCLAVTTAVVLCRARRRALGSLVLVVTAAGPLTVVAARARH